jgi:hypothetical protein
MTQPAPRQPDGHEPVPSPVLLATLADDDALQAEWGYEAADPALQARLWGEAALSFEDR